MEDTERLLIERACERLVTQYCHFVDHGEAARVAGLFTEDGVWSSPETTMAGHAAIRAGFQRRQDNVALMSRHVCSNLLIDVESVELAHGVVYLTLYRNRGEAGRRVSPSAAPSIIGEYRDIFRRTDLGWRFARRDISVSFAVAEH